MRYNKTQQHNRLAINYVLKLIYVLLKYFYLNCIYSGNSIHFTQQIWGRHARTLITDIVIGWSRQYKTIKVVFLKNESELNANQYRFRKTIKKCVHIW